MNKAIINKDRSVTVGMYGNRNPIHLGEILCASKCTDCNFFPFLMLMRSFFFVHPTGTTVEDSEVPSLGMLL